MNVVAVIVWLIMAISLGVFILTIGTTDSVLAALAAAAVAAGILLLLWGLWAVLV